MLFVFKNSPGQLFPRGFSLKLRSVHCTRSDRAYTIFGKNTFFLSCTIDFRRNRRNKTKRLNKSFRFYYLFTRCRLLKLSILNCSATVNEIFPINKISPIDCRVDTLVHSITAFIGLNSAKLSIPVHFGK